MSKNWIIVKNILLQLSHHQSHITRIEMIWFPNHQNSLWSVYRGNVYGLTLKTAFHSAKLGKCLLFRLVLFSKLLPICTGSSNSECAKVKTHIVHLKLILIQNRDIITFTRCEHLNFYQWKKIWPHRVASTASNKNGFKKCPK